MIRKLVRILQGILAVLCCIFLLIPQEASAVVYGTSEILLHGCDATGNTNTETSFGDLTADAVAQWCGAEIALLPSADFGTNVQPGAVTEQTLEQCLQNNSELAVASLTSAQLYEMLEIGVSHLTLGEDGMIDWGRSQFDGYLQISGIQVTCDVSAQIGQRIQAIALADGAQLDRGDMTAQYRVASTRALLTGAYGYPTYPEKELELVGTEREAVAAYIREKGAISEPEMARFRLQGSRDWLKNNWLTMALVFLTVCLIMARLRYTKTKKDVWRSSRTATAEEIRREERKNLKETGKDND